MLKALRKKAVERMASYYVAGPELDDALAVCDWARRKGIATNIEPWPSPQDSPELMLERYSASAKAVKAEGYNCTLGVKPGALGGDLGLFREVVEVARELHIRIHLGSTDLDSAALNFNFLEKVSTMYSELGCTLPSRWRRSLDDTRRVIELGYYVRIVKGQWIDPGAPRMDARKNFLAIVSTLAGQARHIGVCTHDKKLAKESLELLSSSAVPFEMEQFFSLPINGFGLAKKVGCPFRIHVAYGAPALPYNTRFALQRPALILWAASDILRTRSRPWTKGG